MKELNIYADITFVREPCSIEDFLQLPLPDVIILDMQMPQMDGIECLKHIRTRNEFENIPVIMNSVTSYRSEEALSAGANYFVLKEASLDNMRNTLLKILDNK